MKIDHTAIWTENLEVMKDFYLKYFECSVNEKYINPARRFSSYFITFNGGGRIELMSRADVAQFNDAETLGLAHIAINVGSREKVDRLTAQLERDGYIITGRPRITGDGYYESVITDPENNLIEIISH
jgi:lactoylglutathione lyase